MTHGQIFWLVVLVGLAGLLAWLCRPEEFGPK
jgi:hypothetical protein